MLQQNYAAVIEVASYHVHVVVDGFDLHLELVDLAVVGAMRNRQVVHGERPEGGVELRAQVVPYSR